ncbi:hypothetical protein [Streptomyces spectabilis]|uniref:Calcium-binding protein n=1 Tax=Streptomyces spectabilis TaxID=68270 RepID=A0A516RJU8_STRST|nr:hypothetical protein [Streptomyces spectabilis]QDQ15914.1 hypothetical protein FH965_39610 [Streptomyces spectabilis]
MATLMAALTLAAVTLDAAHAGAVPPASNCFVNGQPQSGPEIYGTAGDDDIRCDRLVSGDVIFAYQGNDTIRVTFNYAGVINGGNGQDTIRLEEENTGLIQAGDGSDDVIASYNAHHGGIHGNTGDDEIQVLLNEGNVDGGPGNDVCRVNEGIVLNCNP